MENYEDIDIKRILEIIFSKKIFIILILLLSIILGYVYSYYYKKPEYQSSVKILLVADENKTNKELTQTDLNINSSLISTYSSIAKSTNVIEKTIKNLGLNISVSKLQKNIEAKQIDNTQFLKITVKDENAETAKDIANELSKVFTEQIKEIYNLENISIVDKAEIESIPCNVNHAKDMILFTGIGLFISMVVIMIIYFFDDTMKNEKEIEKSIKLKSIGTLPRDKDKEELITENNPKSHIVESIKTIRTNILYATNKKVILLTSSKEKEGKTWVANNLAVAFAQAGKKIILVDANLRKANDYSKVFDIEKGEGLSDFIKEISEEKLENLEKSRKYIKETKIPNLHILENGTIPPNPAELISSSNMKKLLDVLKSMYDIVLLDGTPCLSVADSIALSSMVDGTILVAENKKTKIAELKKAKRLIEDVNGNILGVITNKSEIQKGKYYGKKYGYYYGEKAEGIEKITEKQKIISLEEIIKTAKENINEEEKNLEKEIIVPKQDNELDKIDEKEQINYEVRNVKHEILGEIKKLKKSFIAELQNDNTEEQINNITNNMNDLKENQDTNNKELLEKFQTISNQLTNNKEEYSKTIENINDKLTSDKEEYLKTIEEINDKLVNHKEEYSKTIENINDKLTSDKEEYLKTIEDINYKLINNREEYSKTIAEVKEKDDENLTAVIQQFISEINSLKSEIKNLKESQATTNTELLEKIANMKYEEKLQEISEKLEEDKEKHTNIISFESLKEKRKKSNKKVFKIEDGIDYDDLERLSTCVIDLNKELTSAVAIN